MLLCCHNKISLFSFEKKYKAGIQNTLDIWKKSGKMLRAIAIQYFLSSIKKRMPSGEAPIEDIEEKN